MDKRVLAMAWLGGCLIPAAALAEPATPEGAKSVLDGYAAYFTQKAVEGGIVKVAPDGESYKVTWDLQKAIEMAGDAQGARVEPFVYSLTLDGAKRHVHASAFPKIEVAAPPGGGSGGGSLSFTGASFDSDYDPAAPDFLKAKAKYAGAKLNVTINDPGSKAGEVEITETNGEVTLGAVNSVGGTGSDVTLASAIEAIAETIKSAGADTPPMTVTAKFGKSSAGMRIDALRSAPMAELWRFGVAHVDDDDTPPELRAKARAVLPLWNAAKVDAHVASTDVDAVIASLTAKGLAEAISLSGVAPRGEGHFALSIDGLDPQSILLPEWVSGLRPLSFAMDVGMQVDGFDKMVDVMLDDENLGGTMSDESQDKETALYQSGHPRLTIDNLTVSSPTGDLTAKGDVSLDGVPSLRLHVTAGKLDDLVAVAKKAAGDDKQLPEILLGVAYMKGIAKKDPDGRLSWDIVSKGKDVTINGAKMPSGK